MAISGDYPHLIAINGFLCRNCSEAALAERHIDPADPASGPFGVNGESPGKQATKNHFSPEARNAEMLKVLHEQQAQARMSVAGAYGAAGLGAAPGQFVDRTA